MREEDESNWFSKWEEQLPSPDELMPLTQSLITPHLLLAFDLQTPFSQTLKNQSPVVAAPDSGDFESSELGNGGGGSGDEPARTLKRPRLVWTPQLHKRFVDAVAHLGIKNAVPKTIMQLMSVDGLTRENVASHLQKYRLYLKRMQGHSGGGGSGLDSATDHLFASSPVPAQFFNPVRGNSEQFLPFVPVSALQQQQMAVAVAGHSQYRQMGHFENPFLARQAHQQQQQQQQVHRMGTPVHKLVPSYVDDLNSATPTSANGTKALTLFPTGDN